jgi:hypothetical protein
VHEHTPTIEVGKTYEVTHPWKGRFTIRVRQTDEDFTEGCVVGGPPETRSGPDHLAWVRPGSPVILLNANCSFRLCTGAGDDRDKAGADAGGRRVPGPADRGPGAAAPGPDAAKGAGRLERGTGPSC